jgi:hypothetical protein
MVARLEYPDYVSKGGQNLLSIQINSDNLKNGWGETPSAIMRPTLIAHSLVKGRNDRVLRGITVQRRPQGGGWAPISALSARHLVPMDLDQLDEAFDAEVVKAMMPSSSSPPRSQRLQAASAAMVCARGLQMHGSAIPHSST